jgi:hypothetical protein
MDEGTERIVNRMICPRSIRSNESVGAFCGGSIVQSHRFFLSLVCFGIIPLWHGHPARVKMQSWAGRPYHISSRSRNKSKSFSVSIFPCVSSASSLHRDTTQSSPRPMRIGAPPPYWLLFSEVQGLPISGTCPGYPLIISFHQSESSGTHLWALLGRCWAPYTKAQKSHKNGIRQQ